MRNIYSVTQKTKFSNNYDDRYVAKFRATNYSTGESVGCYDIISIQDLIDNNDAILGMYFKPDNYDYPTRPTFIGKTAEKPSEFGLYYHIDAIEISRACANFYKHYIESAWLFDSLDSYFSFCDSNNIDTNNTDKVISVPEGINHCLDLYGVVFELTVKGVEPLDEVLRQIVLNNNEIPSNAEYLSLYLQAHNEVILYKLSRNINVFLTKLVTLSK